jgi:hypothetical protein
MKTRPATDIVQSVTGRKMKLKTDIETDLKTDLTTNLKTPDSETP